LRSDLGGDLEGVVEEAVLMRVLKCRFIPSGRLLLFWSV